MLGRLLHAVYWWMLFAGDAVAGVLLVVRAWLVRVAWASDVLDRVLMWLVSNGWALPHRGYAKLSQEFGDDDAGADALHARARMYGALEKRPEHVAVVLDEAAPLASMVDHVARLSVWCVETGFVRALTVFDASGRLTGRVGDVRAVVLGTLERDAVLRARLRGGGLRVRVFSPRDAAAAGECDRAGDFIVRVVDQMDGRQDIVRVARELCTRDRAISAGDVDAQLRATSGSTDPEVALVVAPVLSLNGLLPWQMRVTEIVHAPPPPDLGGRLPYAAFARCMLHYGGCAQRFGT